MSSGGLRPANLLPFALGFALCFAAQTGSALANGAAASRVTAGEIFVVGGVEDGFAAGARQCAKAITLGSFECANGGLRPTNHPPHTDALWFAQPGPAVGLPLRDGVVRARLRLGTKPDISVLVRTHVDATAPERMTALGFSFEAKKVVAHQWTDGLVREMGVAVRQDFRKRDVELVITLAGPSIVAVVLDATSLDVLATLAVTQAGAAPGGVGFRVARGQSADGAVQTLSVVNAAAPTPEQPGGINAPLSGQRRWARAAGPPPKTLPPNLKKLFVPLPTTGAFAVVGSPRELAQVRRFGIRLTNETADFGYKWLDAATLQTVRAPLATTPAMPAGYVDSAHLEALLRSYEKTYPKIAKVIALGTSQQGRPLLGLKISDNVEIDEPEPAVLLNGGHHGLELISTTVVLDAIDQLLTQYASDRRTRRWVDGLEIFVVPLVNPDGADLFVHKTTFGGRKNGRAIAKAEDNAKSVPDPNQGVDLNRNYPFKWGTLGEIGSRSWPAHYRYRGPSAASEPEVKAMIALANQKRFASALSYHSWATRVLVPYTIPGVKNRPNDEAWTVAEALAKRMPAQPSKRTFRARRLLYPVDGTDQDWFRFNVGTLALLVEVALHNPVKGAMKATVSASRESWRFILERTLRGPTLTVEVVGTDGSPQVAPVSVLESLPINGERWTTRASDGLYHRLLSAPGTYRVKVGTGAGAQTKRVRVGRRGGRVKFELPVE